MRVTVNLWVTALGLLFLVILASGQSGRTPNLGKGKNVNAMNFKGVRSRVMPGGMMAFFSSGDVIATSSFIGRSPPRKWDDSEEEEELDEEEEATVDATPSVLSNEGTYTTTARTSKKKTPSKHAQEYDDYDYESGEDEPGDFAAYNVLFPIVFENNRRTKTNTNTANKKKDAKVTKPPSTTNDDDSTEDTTDGEFTTTYSPQEKQTTLKNNADDEEDGVTTEKVIQRPQRKRPINTYFPIVFRGYSGPKGVKTSYRPFTSISNSFSGGKKGFAISTTEVRYKPIANALRKKKVEVEKKDKDEEEKEVEKDEEKDEDKEEDTEEEHDDDEEDTTDDDE